MADLSSQYPNTPQFQMVDFKTVTPTITTETNSGKLRRVGQAVSYYVFKAKYAPLTPREAGPILGFIRQTQGSLYSFEIVLPEISFTKCYAVSATPKIRANIGIGSVNVSITNCSINSEVLRAGDYFKFANHSKVYQAVINCNSDSSGNATLYFASPTVSNVTVNTNLTIDNVPFTCVISSAEQDHSVGVGGMTTIEVSMREVW